MMEKQRAQGGLIDANCNSNIVIDVSAASRHGESSVEHSADEVDSQMMHLKDSTIIPNTEAVPKDEKVETAINSDKKDPGAQQPLVADSLTNSSKADVAPNVRLGSNSRNLNSSYPLNTRKSGRDFEVKARNLSSSFSSCTSDISASAVRIDHKYHDGRWRPRKKHDFELRAELLEKSQSLDEEKRNAINTDGDKDKTPGVLKTCSDETDVNTKSDRPLKEADQNKESKHVTIHQTASNPPTETIETKPTRRIRQKPPPSLSVKSNRSFTFNQPYSDKDGYGYTYDQGQGQSDDWYYQANDGNQAGNFYNSAEFYRNRHSYHGNSYRGKTGYKGRNRHKNSLGESVISFLIFVLLKIIVLLQF